MIEFTLFALLAVGLIFVVVGFIRSQRHCPPAKIEYRFTPRTFIEDQETPVPVTDIFAKMFFESTPWISHEAGKLLPPPTQRQSLNKFFISQS
jgi:hypothetical protein